MEKHLPKIGGWLMLFLTCLLPVYCGWATNEGPEWLSEGEAQASAFMLGILFLTTAAKLLGLKVLDFFGVWED